LTSLALNAEDLAVAFSLRRYRNCTYFIPPLRDDLGHTKLFIENLLDAIKRSVDVDETPPSWTENYALPGMDKLSQELSRVNAGVEKLQLQASSIQEDLNRLKWIKNTLLFGDGKNLEKAVIEVLNEVGYDPNPGLIGQEDLTFHYGGKHFLAEVKGSTSSASEGHIKQLKAKQTRFEENTKLQVKGILIINPWRQYEPGLREKEGGAFFPDAMMPLVDIWKFCLMTSVQLFVIYQMHLQGKLDRDKLSEGIYKTVGPLKGYVLGK